MFLMCSVPTSQLPNQNIICYISYISTSREQRIIAQRCAIHSLVLLMCSLLTSQLQQSSWKPRQGLTVAFIPGIILHMQKLRNRALNLQCDGKDIILIHIQCPMGTRQLEIEGQRKTCTVIKFYFTKPEQRSVVNLVENEGNEASCSQRPLSYGTDCIYNIFFHHKSQYFCGTSCIFQAFVSSFGLILEQMSKESPM